MPALSSRKNEGIYFVVVDGVPQHCQWQELKDYLRDYAKVNPGYANVLKVNEDSTRVGFCTLRNKTEANRAFEYLVAEGWQGLDIRVSMIRKANIHSDQIERRRGPEQSRRRRLATTSPALTHFTRVIPNPIGQLPIAPPPYNMSKMLQEVNRIPSSVVAPTQHPQFVPVISLPTDCEQQERLCNPSPYESSYAPQTRLSETLYHPERTEIHIARLPHDIKTSSLKTTLSRFGTVTNMHVRRGKSKSDKRCSATAKYKIPIEAAYAIQGLNGKKLNGQTLEVKYDRSERSDSGSGAGSGPRREEPCGSSSQAPATRVQPLGNGPLVVNGAKGPSYHRKCREETEADSTENTSSDNDVESRWAR